MQAMILYFKAANNNRTDDYHLFVIIRSLNFWEPFKANFDDIMKTNICDISCHSELERAIMQTVIQYLLPTLSNVCQDNESTVDRDV